MFRINWGITPALNGETAEVIDKRPKDDPWPLCTGGRTITLCPQLWVIGNEGFLGPQKCPPVKRVRHNGVTIGSVKVFPEGTCVRVLPGPASSVRIGTGAHLGNAQ